MRQLANPHQHILTGKSAEAFADTLWALASPIRMELLSLILAAPDGLTTVQLVAQVQKGQPAISHHMKILSRAGFVDRPGRRYPYKVVPGALDYVASFLRSDL